MSNVPDIVEFMKRGPGKSMYDLGYKFCQHCKKFFQVLSRRCVVCGEWLRSKPRGSDRKRYNLRNKIYDKAYSSSSYDSILQ